MHDWMLAKQIINELVKIAKDKKMDKIKRVNIEAGNVALAHDVFLEHSDDINIENLAFGLKNLSKNTVFENAKFEIKEVSGNAWKITDIEI